MSYGYANTMSLGDVLEDAQRVIVGQGREDCREARDSFRRIAALWSTYLDDDVTWLDVAQMMIMLKQSRTHDDKMHDSLISEQASFNGEY